MSAGAGDSQSCSAGSKRWRDGTAGRLELAISLARTPAPLPRFRLLAQRLQRDLFRLAGSGNAADLSRPSARSSARRPSVVLQNLLMCMVCFYSLYYIVVSLCIGILKVEEVDSLLAPFDYTTQPSWHSPKYLVGVISTEVTYFLGGLIFAWIVEEWVWDYAITVTLLHVGLTVSWLTSLLRNTGGWLWVLAWP
ncbi:transmembrane protein 244 isoform X2 [Astyanax mexicanus]|uniref:transmembrane protein 244 isoform X2 n=1 Tax=Astyanax mexicanus TaxID=7994 RepID=UPI0020CB0375|nr:transmembrane protein 244 isoform X2 [Astyanax mexicanus]